MPKTAAFISISTIFLFLFFAAPSPAKAPKTFQQNNAPIVKITSPANNSAVATGAPVHYSITVSDKEDGESKYDEINPKEVLLEVKYIGEGSTINQGRIKEAERDAPGLAAIRTSNCFNCHGFDEKTMGPTFSQISDRYKPTSANIALLAKRIREGSKDIWGKESMPTHPELTTGQAQNIVKWIMKIASNDSVHYYIGTEGMIRLKTINKTNNNAAYLFKATYTDHGINNTGKRLTGEDVVVLHTK